MAKSKMEHVWQIMKKFDFYEENKIEGDFLCLLCKTLLTNAYICPCGCRFCFDCISNYLNGKKKLCPGNTDECTIELLCLNDNVFVDHAMNMRIAKLIVKCPEKLCEFKDELRNIDYHIRICNYRYVRCPYTNIGCYSSNMNASSVIDHLEEQVENHTKLLIDCIDNLNNEIRKLKIIVDELRDENKTLKCEINEIKLNIEKNQMKCDEQDREIDLLNEDMVALRNVDKYTREDVDELKSDQKRKEKTFEELQNKCDYILNDGELMRLKMGKLEFHAERNEEFIELLNKKFKQEIESFNNKYRKMKNKIFNAKQENKNKEKDLLKIIDEMKGGVNEIDDNFLEIEINQNNKIYGEFVWKIDDINDKMKNAKTGIGSEIYSGSFYTHKRGYKMCLSVYPDGDGGGMGTHLSVYFHLMKGEFDNDLEWPFKYDVTLSLINQQTQFTHVSITVKYDDLPNSKGWSRPIDERNLGLGYPKFVELNELSTNPNLILNNQIFIKCFVNISL